MSSADELEALGLVSPVEPQFMPHTLDPGKKTLLHNWCTALLQDDAANPAKLRIETRKTGVDPSKAHGRCTTANNLEREPWFRW